MFEIIRSFVDFIFQEGYLRKKRSAHLSSSTHPTAEGGSDAPAEAAVLVGEAHFSSLLASSNLTTEMNCSSGNFICAEVSCPIGPFTRHGSAVDLSFELQLDMKIIGTVSQAYFALHKTLHKVQNFQEKKNLLVLRLPLRHF
jgi:hypothetical protein